MGKVNSKKQCKKQENNNRKIFIMLALVLLVGISIGYAALATVLSITGNTIVQRHNWKIKYINLEESAGSVVATTPAQINADEESIEFSAKLLNLGDYYEFTVDMANTGTINGVIDSVKVEGLDLDAQKVINSSITYVSDGNEVKKGDILDANTSKKIKVRVQYKNEDEINESDMLLEDLNFNLSFKTEFVKAE